MVRISYGMFFLPNGAQQGANTYVPGYSISQNLQTTDQKTPVLQLSAGPPPYVYPDASVRNGAVANGAAISWWPYSSPQPYVQQWQLSVQRQLGQVTMVELAYVGNKGTHLLFPRDMNQVPPGALWGPGDAESRRPYPQYSQIQELYNDGDSVYHALQIKGSRRFSQGLTFMANYTFSKSIDNSSYDTTTWQRQHLPDHYEHRSEPRLSQFDETHRVVLSYVYELPAGHGRKWMNRGGITDAIRGMADLGQFRRQFRHSVHGSFRSSEPDWRHFGRRLRRLHWGPVSRAPPLPGGSIPPPLPTRLRIRLARADARIHCAVPDRGTSTRLS